MVYIFVRRGLLGWQAEAHREKDGKICSLAELLDGAEPHELENITCQVDNYGFGGDALPFAFGFALQNEMRLAQIRNAAMGIFSGLATYLAISLLGYPGAGGLAGLLAGIAAVSHLDSQYSVFKKRINALAERAISYYSAPISIRQEF